jgi:hypothetical protein
VQGEPFAAWSRTSVDRKERIKRMQFFIMDSYYGGNVNFLEQVARDNNAQLITVKGYA